MPIIIEAPKTSRIRGLAEAEPQLTAKQIATRLGVLTSEVRSALARQGRRRIKSAAR
jgi:hypothetical protein